MTDVPREAFGDPLYGMVGDVGDDVAEVSLWLKAVHFGGFEDRVDRGGVFATCVEAREEPVLRPASKTVAANTVGNTHDIIRSIAAFPYITAAL